MKTKKVSDLGDYEHFPQSSPRTLSLCCSLCMREIRKRVKKILK